MMKESLELGLSTVFNSQDLTGFSNAQAWTGEFRERQPVVTINVENNDKVAFKRYFNRGIDLSKEAVGMFTAERLIHFGVSDNIHLGGLDTAVNYAQKALEKDAINEDLPSIVASLEQAVEKERFLRVSSRLSRTSQFIADHPSLWIVAFNREVRGDSSRMKVGVARLVGLALDTSEDILQQKAQAVLKGKDGTLSLLKLPVDNDLRKRPYQGAIKNGFHKD